MGSNSFWGFSCPNLLFVFLNLLLLGTCYIRSISLLRPTLMGTKNLNRNGANPFVFFVTKGVDLVATVFFWHGFDNL